MTTWPSSVTFYINDLAGDYSVNGAAEGKQPTGTGGYLSDDCYQSGNHNAQLRGAPH